MILDHGYFCRIFLEAQACAGNLISANVSRKIISMKLFPNERLICICMCKVSSNNHAKMTGAGNFDVNAQVKAKALRGNEIKCWDWLKSCARDSDSEVSRHVIGRLRSAPAHRALRSTSCR